MVSVHDAGRESVCGELAWFRERLFGCLTSRADALFELTDALLCADGPVAALPELSLVAEHRRGHGAVYEGLNQGCIDADGCGDVLARQPLPRCGDGRIVLGIDVSNWLRPDAATSPDRLFCHTYGRSNGQAEMIPGWPYSWVAALEPGRTSWTALLDVARLGPDDEDTALAAAQLRAVVQRLIAAGQWSQGDPWIWIVADSGYDGPRLAFLLADLPVRLLVRTRSDRVMHSRPAPRQPGQSGRPARHGAAFRFAEPDTWPEPAQATVRETSRYGTAVARCWDRLHPRLTHRGVWAEHDGDVPIVEGTVIRLQVERLPGHNRPKPVWLWFSGTDVTPQQLDDLWQMFLRRFDLEHTFRFLKQTLGWSTPRLRTPHAADRWSWLICAAYTQLRLARPLAEDLRRPWEKAAKPGRLTPARVRRGFRHIRPTTALPASAPKPTRAGPGRTLGSKNTHRATRHDPGKKIKTETAPKTATKQTA